MKGSIRSQKTFINILSAIIINVLFTTVILSWIQYYSFGIITTKYINEANTRLLYQISNTLDYFDQSARNLGLSMLMNNDTKLLINNTDDHLFLISQSFNNVSKVANSAFFVNSAYIYNSSLNRYYSINPPLFDSKNDFFDKEIIEIISSDEKDLIKPLPRLKPINPFSENSEYESVYTYIFYESSITGSAKNDAIILNIKTDWLTEQVNTSKHFNKLFGGDSSNTFIIDKSGNIVNHSNKSMFLKNVSDKLYIQKVLSSDNSSGYFIDTIENLKSIITYIKPKNSLDWTFVSITPYEIITTQLNSLKKTAVLTCLGIIVIGFIAAYVLSRKVYSPIGGLVKNIRSLTQKLECSRRNVNELDFISEAFNITLEKSKSLEDFKRKNFEAMKQETIKHIVLSPEIDIVEIQSRIKEFNIILDPDKKLKLIVFKIDNHLDFFKKFNEKDVNLMKFAIQNISEELVSEHFSCETVDMDSDHIILLVNASKNKDYEGICDKKLVEIIQKIQEACRIYLDFSVSATVSKTIPNISGIYNLYKSSLDISNYRLIFGHNSIIEASRINLLNISEYTFPTEMQSRLLDELKLGKMDNVARIFTEMAETILTFSYSNIVLSYTILASNIFNTLSQIEKNSMMSFDTNYYSFNKEISSLETVEAINKRFIELFDYIYSCITKAKGNRNTQITEHIVEIISKNYSDPSLSLDSIANEIKLTNDYIVKIFKEHTAYSITDFITRTRLEKARQLLLETNYNVNKIANKIGFTNDKYLYKVFKKYFGVTPKEFRIKNSIDPEI